MYCFYLLFCVVYFMYVSVLGVKKFKNMELNELIIILLKRKVVLKNIFFIFNFRDKYSNGLIDSY